MPHRCGPACECQRDLDAALAALEASTRVLASTLPLAQSWELVDKRYAELRAANAKVRAAMAEYLEHLQAESHQLLFDTSQRAST